MFRSKATKPLLSCLCLHSGHVYSVEGPWRPFHHTTQYKSDFEKMFLSLSTYALNLQPEMRLCYMC